MDKQETFRKAKEAIVDADETKAFRIIDEARAEGMDLLELLLSGFGAGNDEIGERFDKGVLSLPELIYAAEVMKSVTNTILEYLNEEGEGGPVLEKKGTGRPTESRSTKIPQLVMPPYGISSTGRDS